MNEEERAAKRAKLPRWAQEEIRALETQLRRARDAAEELSDPNAEAYTNPYGFPKPVARKGEPVRFVFDGIEGHRWIDVRRRGDALELMASSGLVIAPRVTNVVHVAVQGR